MINLRYSFERKRSPLKLIHLKVKSTSRVGSFNLYSLLILQCRFRTEMFDHRQFSELWELHTSGITAEAFTSAHYKSLLTYEQGVLFSSYCLNDNVSSMFNLWEELFCR